MKKPKPKKPQPSNRLALVERQKKFRPKVMGNAHAINEEAMIRSREEEE